MRKIITIIIAVGIIGILYISLQKTILDSDDLGLSFSSAILDDENRCFKVSYEQISDSLLTAWNTSFIEAGIEDNPFAIMLNCIDYFNRFDQRANDVCLSFDEIITKHKTNIISSAIVTCAIMQKLGWDFQYFYMDDEHYLGINFIDAWEIRRGNWVERDGKSYFLKEFDCQTPVGELKTDAPVKTYKCLITKNKDLQPLPLLNGLPRFSNDHIDKELVWSYKNKLYRLNASIPEEQVVWTMNLPVSLHGMVASGVFEFYNIGIVDDLVYLVQDHDEYDRVNIIYKLSQSDSIFIYDNKQPIKSITNQLIQGRNDCDGRSIFLYCLLQIVLGYRRDDIVFINWENHLALGLRPQTKTAKDILKKENAEYIDDEYYILDAAYMGDTRWGSKMKKLSSKYEIIR